MGEKLLLLIMTDYCDGIFQPSSLIKPISKTVLCVASYLPPAKKREKVVSKGSRQHFIAPTHNFWDNPELCVTPCLRTYDTQTHYKES